MIYALLCYHSEDVVCSWSKEEDAAVMAKLGVVQAVAVSKARGAAPALAMIEPLEQPLSGYFYFFGVKGALLLQLGRRDEAKTAFDQAIACANTVAEASHIRMQLDRLAKDDRDAGAGSAGDRP